MPLIKATSGRHPGSRGTPPPATPHRLGPSEEQATSGCPAVAREGYLPGDAVTVEPGDRRCPARTPAGVRPAPAAAAPGYTRPAPPAPRLAPAPARVGRGGEPALPAAAPGDT